MNGEASSDDPVLGAFLAFIEHDMTENVTSIEPLSADLLKRAARLVRGMGVEPDEWIR